MLFLRSITTVLLISLFMHTSTAQSARESVIGEYHLEGVHEVGSGIKLNADHTFEFFFIYGALDRFGKGTWKRQGSQIILTGPKHPMNDFALVTSRSVPGNKLTVRIAGKNANSPGDVECVVKSGTNVQQELTDSKGEAHFSKQPIETLSLRFEFAPERYSVFSITNKAHNYFEFRFEPWILDVFFENVSYTISANGLEGPHPLLEPGKTYSFERE